MRLLVIEGDFPFWRGFVVEEWRRLPFDTLLLSQAPSLWRAGDWGAIEPLPMKDGGLDVTALRQLVAAHGGAAGALTVFEPAVGRTLEVQRALGLPELSTLAPRALRNKAEMVAVMERAGLAVPATVHGTDADSVAAEALGRLPFPLICKPAELAGKAGVTLARDEAALREGIRLALGETLPFEIDGVPTSVVGIFGCEQRVLVQEYIEGPEYSVEAIVSRGEPHVLAITEKIHSGPPLFEELGHLQPARLGDEDERAIAQYAIAAMRAFGLLNCCVHLELRLSRRGPVMMEINCRLAGDMIGRLMELRSGMNAGELLARLALGEPVEPPSRWIGAAGVRMVTVAQGGIVRALTAPVLRSDREMAAFELAAGSPVHAPKPGGATRVGYLIAAAETRDETEARLSAMASEIRVDVEPAPAG